MHGKDAAVGPTLWVGQGNDSGSLRGTSDSSNDAIIAQHSDAPKSDCYRGKSPAGLAT